MGYPKVVIGLPVYNGQKYLGAAIESHLSQSYGDFILTISDNGSTDATQEICEDFARRDSRIRYQRSSENRGILWNHRQVMSAIESPEQYFRWAGADDIMGADLLQSMVGVLDSCSDVVAVMPDTKNIDEAGNIIGSMERSLDLQAADAYQRARDVLLANYQHVVAYGLLRVSTLRAMRTKPDYIGWDPIFLWELALRGKIVQPAGPTLLRRFHAGSISRVKKATEMRKWVEPNARAGMEFPHWTWNYEHWRALLHTPLRSREKLRITLFLARTTTWQRAALFRDVVQAARRVLGLSDEYTF